MSASFRGDELRAYRTTLAGLEPLDREEERALARRWNAGEGRAGERLIAACLPFVMKIAFEYRRWGVPLEDIVQQGNIGLLRAAKKFDPDRDVRLATYAAYWIRAEIRDYVVRAYRLVRIGTTKGERRAIRTYRMTGESDPSALAKVSGMTEERVRTLLPLLASREASLDARSGATGSALSRIPSTRSTPEDEVAAGQDRARVGTAVRTALRDLSERERLIVKERMMREDPVTLQELGDRLHVSKERVRQLEARARGKLRNELETLREVAVALC
jgi:RNA polymerase sigma-32 factor